VDNYNDAKLSDVDDSYYYGVRCTSCLRHARVSLVRTRIRLGNDFPVADLIKHLKCSTCGSKKVTVAFLKPSQAVGNLWPLFQEKAI
jgi:hypothetical protein